MSRVRRREQQGLQATSEVRPRWTFVCSTGAGVFFCCVRSGTRSFFGAAFLSATTAFFDFGDGFTAGVVSFFGGAGCGSGRWSSRGRRHGFLRLSHQFHLIRTAEGLTFGNDEEVHKERDAHNGGMQEKRIEDRKCERIS